MTSLIVESDLVDDLKAYIEKEETTIIPVREKIVEHPKDVQGCAYCVGAGWVRMSLSNGSSATAI